MIKNRTTSPELEEEMRKSIQENPGGIDPQLMEYATNLFPNLKTAALPENYNELAQKEALDNNPLPDNYNELAQQEALEDNTIPEDASAPAPVSELDRVKNLALERLKKQNLVSSTGQPPLDLLEREMGKIRQEESEATSQLGEERYDKYAAQEKKNAQLKRLGMLGDMSPDLSNRAYELFPELKDMIGQPRDNYVESEQSQATPEVMPQAAQQSSPQAASQRAASQRAASAAMPSASEAPSQPAEQSPMAPSATPTMQNDIEKMIQQASEEEDRAALWKQSARLRDAAMGAGSGTILKTDTSLYEDLEKKAQRPMKNYILKQELEDKKAKNDPNSAISKLMRKSLSDLNVDMSGFESVSYAQLEKIYPAYTQALYTKIAADAKKEENQIRRSEAANAKMEKLDQTKQKQLVDHINYSVNNLKKAYENYSKSQTTIDSISNILGGAKNKVTPGTADVTMLYSFISSLDPASTVREGEIALSKSAMSLWGRIKQGTLQLGGGDLLDSDTRKSIEEIMKVVQAAREKQFAKQKANLIQAGVGKGLDKDMLNSYIYPEIDASSALGRSKKEEIPVEDKLKQFEERLNKNQSRIEELKKKKEM